MQPNYRNPGVAAVLSFLVPGLGQIYNGLIAEGLLWLILEPILVALAWYFLGRGTAETVLAASSASPALGWSVLLGLVAIGFWVYQIYRSYQYALNPSGLDRRRELDRAESHIVCAKCGARLAYQDEACPYCGSTKRKWA